jgi:hypothetical protein
MTLSLDVQGQSPDGREVNRPLYLRMKGIALDAIHGDLVRTLGKDAVAYSVVTKYARNAQFSGRKEATLPKLQMWNAVLSMRQYSRLLPNFRFRPCASFRGGSVFRDPPCTQSLRFMVRHLRWVPHFLTVEHMQIRVQMAVELLQVLSV